MHFSLSYTFIPYSSLCSGYVNNQQESWGFSFDEVMNNMSQDEVYERCGAPVTQSVLDGYLYSFPLSSTTSFSYISHLAHYIFIMQRYNGTIMCYGQTGAGKTFTMTGTTENYRHRGIFLPSSLHFFTSFSILMTYKSFLLLLVLFFSFLS